MKDELCLHSVKLYLFIEKMNYYEKGIVDIIRQFLIGIGLTEPRAFFSYDFISSHYNIYSLKNKNKEVSCTYVTNQEILEKPYNPNYNNKPITYINDNICYENYKYRNSLFYCGVVDKWIRIVKLSGWELFCIKTIKKLH